VKNYSNIAQLILFAFASMGAPALLRWVLASNEPGLFFFLVFLAPLGAVNLVSIAICLNRGGAGSKRGENEASRFWYTSALFLIALNVGSFAWVLSAAY
jgi:hypothetical protein